MKNIAGVLAGFSLIGLGLIASGVVSWGVRAVALFTLVGLIWLFVLIVLFGVELHRRFPAEHDSN